jgi:hypothetical protein
MIYSLINQLCKIPQDNDEIFCIDYPMEYIWSPKKLKELSKYKLVIVNMCSEHWGDGSGSQAIVHCQNANLNFLILTHNPYEHLVHPRVIYLPYWYHYSKKYFKYVVPALSRKYNLSCLNGNPRPHRIANYLLLLNKTYVDQTNISFFNVLPDNIPWRADDVILTESESTQWNQIKNQLPLRNAVSASEALKQPDSEINLPAITDSYIHLVTETTVVPNIFLTEKTWKPIAGGTLFLTFSNPGSVAHLRDLGVDVYDDIIDHAYYDNELDWRTRLSCIHTLIDNLIVKDLTEIYKITKDRRLENQRKFFAGEFDTRYNQEILFQIEKLTNVSIR